MTPRSPHHHIVLAVLCGGWLGACARAQPPTFDEAHRAALADSARAFMEGYTTLIADGAWDELANMYVSDDRFLVMESGRIAYRSVEEVALAYQELSEQFDRARLDVSDVSVLPMAPGWAHVSGLFEQTFARTGEEGFSFGGALTLTLTHTAEGWRIVTAHTSVEVPRP